MVTIMDDNYQEMLSQLSKSPSFSLGWNVARENFWKPLESVVNQFKLRGSWGELGNQNTSNRCV